ncbi:MAG: precorrin-3B C(17)-methyltransferase [Lachnospiraceae bacterium]|nr:precorrin-3B C(17)-methyltransferase [Lachnospiraceae bacterium]
MAKLIYIVGMGPGDESFFTGQAKNAIEQSEIVIGYTVYVELMKKFYPEKCYRTTGMKKEVERCELCLKLAEEGRTVALICSGDAGVYGLASLMYELRPEDSEIELVVVPGITAANSGAAVLGAPLNHDYCVISLSDLMTPWEVIEKRIIAAIQGDFSMALYNPSSHKRVDYLQKACDIMLSAGASPERACGYVENIGREGTSATTCTLQELRDCEVNMFTTVFIGNSMTFIRENHLVTPRGYLTKTER